jgi:dsRNA-specific ribonuclease
MVREEVIAESSGRTKKEAQQSAARLALESLKHDQSVEIGLKT